MVDLQAAGWISLGVAAGFLLDWAAVAFRWERLKPFTKALAMVMVILWTGTMAEGGLPISAALLIAAQACGLLGDIMLLFPEKAFAAGLSAFLVGHIFYLGLLVSRYWHAFGFDWARAGTLGWTLLAIGLWGALLALFYWIFYPVPGKSEVSRELWVGIQAYAWLVSAIAALALVVAWRFNGNLLDRFALPFGALLFLFSDAMLIYNRFLKPFDRAQLWVRITYHLAQFSLAWGFMAILNG